MISIYPGVCRICTPRRSVHLRYPCISVHPLLLSNDVLGGRDRASWEMHLEAEIEWTQRYTPRPWSSEFGDALGGRDWVNSEMHLEAITERVWRCTCRLVSSEIGGVLGSGRFGGRRDGSWDSGWEGETGWERETVDLRMMLYLMYAVLGVKSWSWHGEIEMDDLTSCS